MKLTFGTWVEPHMETITDLYCQFVEETGSDLEIGEFAFDLFCNYQEFVQEMTDIWSGESWYDESVITEICTKYILKTNQFDFLRS